MNRLELLNQIDYLLRSCTCHTEWVDVSCDCCGCLPKFSDEMQEALDGLEGMIQEETTK